ncbi:hypothetical protein GDO86_001622 [Hymenochirus boettgeri]|uniref:Ig-like domain-containing protein n=1 Tax=Hymenochirus boettgeri TaxID=247094 RepID=A0A8T2KLR7_9PIPI|nr:hypothetical protein GDO86_001622 [Hymenochirus boettgeri]
MRMIFTFLKNVSFKKMHKWLYIYIFFSTGSVCLSDVIQPPTMHTSAGADLTLSCSHTSITSGDYIHWYKLLSDQGPQHIIGGFKDSRTNSVNMIFSKDRKFSQLHVQSVNPEDSGLYLCALSDTAMQTRALLVQYVL